MPRLLLCLAVAFAAGVGLLMLRQQRLQLRYECNVLHARMLDLQRTLWRQQVQVAAGTTPAALEQVLGDLAAKDALDAEAAAADPAGEWSELPDALPADAAEWAVLAAASGDGGD